MPVGKILLIMDVCVIRCKSAVTKEYRLNPVDELIIVYLMRCKVPIDQIM